MSDVRATACGLLNAQPVQDARGVVVRRAGLEDLSDVLRLVDGSARWLRGRGINQWPVPYPEHRLIEPIRNGLTHLAFFGQQPVGTFTLQWSDVEIWGGENSPAGYVHRLAVDRSMAGHGLGAQLLDQAASLVAAEGYGWLRLDCRRDSSGLRGYYELLGFEHVRNADHRPPGFEAALYQRRVSC